MKIITFAAIKGGVGKTTLAFNFGEYLAFKGYKVLLIDLDHQCNLSQKFNVFSEEHNVGNIFDKFSNDRSVTIYHDPLDQGVDISLIAGSTGLDKIEIRMDTESQKDFLLYRWLNINAEQIGLNDFDYIIIDTRPDFGLATKNAIVVSDVLLSPVTPSIDGYDAMFNLQTRLKGLKEDTIDVRTGEPTMTCSLLMIGNMFKNNTRISNDLKKQIKDNKDFIAIIPNKELFNRTSYDKVPLSEMKLIAEKTLDSQTEDYLKKRELSKSDKDYYKRQIKGIDEVSDQFLKMQRSIDKIK